MAQDARAVGSHLRQWRERRRLSQLALALEADVSPRHLSFLENGRATPSREMILHLCERLQIPARERNTLLLAAGFAPTFPVRPLHDPALAAARQAVAQILDGHRPWPAFALDREWNVVLTNAALPFLYEGVAPELLAPPINVLRLSLHPDGLAPRIRNLGSWRAHLLHRLRTQIDLTADSTLVALQHELQHYPAPALDSADRPQEDIVVPLVIETSAGTLSLISTTMVFGTAIDVILSELAIESFFPANRSTRELIASMPD